MGEMGNKEMVHWWEGYVIIKVKGQRLERLINRMMNRRFAAWNLIRTSEEEAEFSLALRDFFELRSLLKETGCRIHILKRVGLPFFIKRVGRRMGLYGGAIAFCVILYILSSMIWSVEIDGVRLPENELLLKKELASLGIKPGSFKFQTEDPKVIQRNIMEKLPEVTWVGFTYNGTQAYLKVVEKTFPVPLKKTNPRNLIAAKKAIIYDLFVESGQPMVKVNQYVKPGDVLVSGVLGTEEEKKIVSAKGKIFGEVWYEGNITVPLKQQRAILTGEREKRYFLNVGPISIKVWGFGEIPFKDFDKDEEVVEFKWKNWTAPISWTMETIFQTKKVVHTVSTEEAVDLGKELGKKIFSRRLQPEAEIKEENVLRKRIENGKVYIKIHYTVIEEISKEQLIIQGD
jgi:similar to stage IV sporulation protein